jgi:hypothetical protein
VTTTASLTGPLAKIARAEELKEEFGTAFDEWVEQKPIGVKGRQDPGSDWFVMTFHILSALPIRLGVIFGDMLNNLRGALDHPDLAACPCKQRDTKPQERLSP